MLHDLYLFGNLTVLARPVHIMLRDIMRILAPVFTCILFMNFPTPTSPHLLRPARKRHAQSQLLANCLASPSELENWLPPKQPVPRGCVAGGLRERVPKNSRQGLSGHLELGLAYVQHAQGILRAWRFRFFRFVLRLSHGRG